jgi:hypothetical protein
MIEELTEYMKNNNIYYYDLNDATKVLPSEYKDLRTFRYKKIEKLLQCITPDEYQRYSNLYDYLKSDDEVCKIIRRYYPIIK